MQSALGEYELVALAGVEHTLAKFCSHVGEQKEGRF
jgi:hypothetical protein